MIFKHNLIHQTQVLLSVKGSGASEVFGAILLPSSAFVEQPLAGPAVTADASFFLFSFLFFFAHL